MENTVKTSHNFNLAGIGCAQLITKLKSAGSPEPYVNNGFTHKITSYFRAVGTNAVGRPLFRAPFIAEMHLLKFCNCEWEAHVVASKHHG